MTPIQEILKLESELTQMFDSDHRVAMALLDHIRTNRKEMLEKEKDMILDAWIDDRFPLDKDWVKKCAEQYYNETYGGNK
jgi:hypothetical protein